MGDETEIKRTDAYWYAAGIVCSTILITINTHAFLLFTHITTCKVRVACSGLIYQKLLRQKKSTNEDEKSGNVINLLSNDVAKFEPGLSYLSEIWKAPILCVLFLIVIYTEIGISGIIGMAFLLGFAPLQGKHSKNMWK